MTRSALLWLTHLWSPDLQAEFESLRAMRGPGTPDVWLLMDSRNTQAAYLARRYRHCHLYDESTLQRLPYPPMREHPLLFHSHLVLFEFFLAHPEFDHYWLVEYDVRYTGAWGSFFAKFADCDHDLLTCHVRRFSQEPGWPWWDWLDHPTETIPKNERLRSFNVVSRSSRRALTFLHQAQLSGWRGFSEVSFPTLLAKAGYAVRDFNDCHPGTYTSSSTSTGRLSVFGTVRYRPSHERVGRHKNMLYHPVKPLALTERPATRRRLLARWLIDRSADLIPRRLRHGLWRNKSR